MPKVAKYKGLYDFEISVPNKVNEVKWGKTQRGECVRAVLEDSLECTWFTYFEGKRELYSEQKCAVFKKLADDGNAVYACSGL